MKNQNRNRMTFFGALALLLALAVSSAAAEDAPPPSFDADVPFTIADSNWVPLYDQLDPSFQKELDAVLKANPEWNKLVRAKKLAVGVVDLSDPAGPRFARVNGNTMMYAASLPKVAILLAAYESIDRGLIALTPEVAEDMDQMIRVSSNAAATRMIERVGFDTIEEVLRSPEYELYDPERGGGLWVGKMYAKTGGRHPDPILGLSHAATVTQVCRLYYMLAYGRIISPDRSRQILAHLADPGVHHKFVHMIEERAPLARIFRKSGTWKQWHSDSVLVLGVQWRRYILVGMVESENGEQILRDLLPVVEDLMAPEPPDTR